MNNVRADYDSPWKEIIERYFPEFMAYYFLELFRFIDWVMTLPLEMEKQFMIDVATYETQERKPYVATFERIATQRGIQQGIEQGMQQAMHELLVATLEIRFGPISADLKARLERVTDTEQLKALHNQALQVESLDEFTYALHPQP